MNETREEILKRDFSEAFINKMKNAIEMSHYKYGWANKTYPELAQAYKCITERLELYINTQNKDYLVDVATLQCLNFYILLLKMHIIHPQTATNRPDLQVVFLIKNLWIIKAVIKWRA